MTPQEFLAVVLPPPGHGLYCAAELTTKKKEHKYEETYDALQQHVDQWVGDKRNAYFALATFEKHGSREAANARHIRAFFIDIDCAEDGPKTYGSKEDGRAAFDAFMADTGLDQLGVPYIVDSGGGYHVYWPLTETQDIATWKPAAENFKRLCKQLKFKIDMTVTADAARVLRYPGTANFKYDPPPAVHIIQVGESFDFAAFNDIVRSKLQGPAATPAPSNVIELPGTRPTAASSTSVNLFANNTTKFKNILKATQSGSGCAQLAHYIEHAEEDGMEPIWRGWLSIAQKCEDGQKAAIWLSNLHPYDTDRMQQKLRAIKGPYPCIKFDSENPGICTKCPHWSKITNPLALGREVKVDVEEKEIVVEEPAAPEAAPTPIMRPKPPKGFAYGEKGGVYQEREVEMADGSKSKKHVMLLPYDLFAVDILNAHGDHTIHMLALRPEGTVDVMVPAKAIVSRDETVKALAQQNVIASFGQGSDQHLFSYVRACVEQAGRERRALKIPDHYGWQGDGNYVYAGRIFSPGKPPVKVPMPGLENIVSSTKEPVGTLDGWRTIINMMISRGLYKHLAVMLLGTGAPLMRFTGLAGLTVHCASTESGTGKSLALELAASVWGHPTRYRTGKSTSAVAMQQRLGLLHCHPLISDELTNVTRKDFEWFPGFLLDMSEGKGKERMESGANKERLNLSTWSSTALLSSNTHGVDWLTGVRKHASEGELRRLLEFIIEEQLSWSADEVEVIKSLHKHYGIVGYKMVEYMVEHQEMLPQLTNETVQRMYKVFNATNDERFWMAGIGCAITAGVLWSQKYMGIIDLPLKQIIEAYKDVVAFMRKSMRTNMRTAEGILNTYVSENFGKLLVIRKHNASNSLMAEFGAGREADESITRSSIAGRVEHDITPGYCDFFIEEQMMKAHCAAYSFGYAAFCKKLADTPHISVEFLKKDMAAKTKAPPMRVQAIKVRRRIEDVDDLLQAPPSLEAA